MLTTLQDSKITMQQREDKFNKFRNQCFQEKEDITAKVMTRKTIPKELKLFREANEKAIGTSVYIANHIDVTADFYKLNNFSDEQRVMVKIDRVPTPP